jgi:hypothetical protein
MTTRVKIRSVGRAQFWSAGRRWTEDGTVVSIVDNDSTPKKLLRACVNERDGNYCLNEELLAEGDSIPVIPARGTRAYWQGNTMVVKHEGKEFQVVTELDFPSKDIDFQNWAQGLREQHIRKGEITQGDYAQIRADSRFLAIENPELPEFEPPQPKPQQQQQKR